MCPGAVQIYDRGRLLCEDCGCLLVAVEPEMDTTNARNRYRCPDCGERWISDPRGIVIPENGD